uniref:Nonstructural protein n=1 Tax=Tarsiger cyanurus ambidensovirus TaxID=2794449 RepID=A0A8A4XE33_9VIRU|nr:MAG: nonstructural protein [Tarsiger cyanurus ambidensovirus]
MACEQGLHEGDENGHLCSDSGDWAGDILCASSKRLSTKTLPSKRKSSEEAEVRKTGKGILETIGKALSALILKWFPHSPDDLVQLKEFISDFPDLYWNESFYKKMASVSFAHAKSEFTKQDTKTICRQRFERPIPFYSIDPLNYFNPYYSAQILARLVLEQNGGDITNAISFITRMFEVSDKLYPKKNTFLITSPPSCGKSYLINSFVKNFWAVGYIQNNKKNSSSDFNYQDAVGMRINLWNECLMEGKAFVEQAKQVWEGDNVSVNVKHERMKILKRTPLFICANNEPWQFCMYAKSAFKDRCFHYKWTKQPWLIKLDAYPVPICWHIIMENYQNVEWWNNVLTVDQILSKRHDDEVFFSNWLKTELTPEEWLYINTQL